MIARNEVFVAQFGDRIVGFATIIAHEGNDAELEGLFVQPSDWRKGIGTALVRQIEREALAWGANRLHDRQPQCRAVLQGGWIYDDRRNENSAGQIALLMVKPVASL